MFKIKRSNTDFSNRGVGLNVYEDDIKTVIVIFPTDNYSGYEEDMLAWSEKVKYKRSTDEDVPVKVIPFLVRSMDDWNELCSKDAGENSTVNIIYDHRSFDAYKNNLGSDPRLVEDTVFREESIKFIDNIAELNHNMKDVYIEDIENGTSKLLVSYMDNVISATDATIMNYNKNLRFIIKKQEIKTKDLMI